MISYEASSYSLLGSTHDLAGNADSDSWPPSKYSYSLSKKVIYW